MRRPMRNFDWELRSCGWHGHVTYRPDEPALARSLSTMAEQGAAWRCLRCGGFVLGEPRGSGPADHAPVVLRGRALRDAAILRLLAVERLVRGLLLVLLAYGIYRFNGARDALEEVFRRDLPIFANAARQLGIDLQDSGPVRLIDEALHARHATLELVTVGVLGYGALELVEGIGLWLLRRWGEYVAVVGTSVFIPLEIYELLERVTWVRLVALAVNVFAVVYLLWTKRLFGLRGGRAAFERERHSVSLIEVVGAAQGGAVGASDDPGPAA